MINLLTTRQVADALGVSTQRVRLLIAQGRLPATRHGRDWAISPADLACLAEQRLGWQSGRPRERMVGADAPGVRARA